MIVISKLAENIYAKSILLKNFNTRTLLFKRNRSALTTRLCEIRELAESLSVYVQNSADHSAEYHKLALFMNQTLCDCIEWSAAKGKIDRNTLCRYLRGFHNLPRAFLSVENAMQISPDKAMDYFQSHLLGSKGGSTKKEPDVPLSVAASVFVFGIILGSVFTFGMQFWNTAVERESCSVVETHFLEYTAFRKARQPREIQEIAIDCSNEKRYFIDGVSINSKLTDALDNLWYRERIILLIHPNSNTIVEFTTEDTTILNFDETTKDLQSEASGFRYLGIFMYVVSLIMGLYCVALLIAQRRKKAKKC